MLRDTKVSLIDSIINNSDNLLKINCHFCQRLFSNEDIKENNYSFAVSYSNKNCYNQEEEHNRLEKIENKYYLSLEICWVTHKDCLKGK